MRHSKIILMIVLVFVVAFQTNIQALNSRLVLKEMTVGEVSWHPNEQMFVAKPFNQPTYLIYKIGNAWQIRPTYITGNVKFFKWSHRGDQLLYWKDGNLYLAKLQGFGDVGDSALLAKASESAANWSPDDKYLAYISDNHVWICTPDLKHRQKITNQAVKEANAPQWSNSGKDIIFQGVYKDGYTMWKVNIKSGETKVINTGLQCTYSKWQLWNDRILVMDDTTSDFKVLTFNGKTVSLTKDGVSGRNIVYYGPAGLYYTDTNRKLFKLENGSPKLIINGEDFACLSLLGKVLSYSVVEKFYLVENFK